MGRNNGPYICSLLVPVPSQYTNVLVISNKRQVGVCHVYLQTIFI